MKCVERRGTLDSQNLSAQLHNIAPPAIHPSGAHQPAPGALANGHSAASMNGTANGRSSTGSDRSVHRSDTLPIPHSQTSTRLGPTGTHLLPSTGSSYREREYDGSHSPYHASARSSQRGPTPPGIATLPGSNEDDDRVAHHHHHPRAHAHAHGHGHARGVNGRGSSGSGSGSRSGSGSAGGSPRVLAARGSKSSDLMDIDADGEEVNADGDAHCVVPAYHGCVLDVNCNRPTFHI